MTLIYVDHNMLAKIASDKPSAFEDSEDYLKFLEQVRRQVYQLDKNHSRVIIMYYFENRDIDQIAAETGLGQQDIRKLLRESLLILKYALAGIVEKRWPDRFKNINTCPICSHPQRVDIEKIISAHKSGESWGKVNKRLRQKIGRTFNPPMVLINHLKYHKLGEK